MGFADGPRGGVRDRLCLFSAFTCEVQHSLSRFGSSSAVSATQSEGPVLQLSSSSEVDVLSIEPGDLKDSSPQSPIYEELVEVVTRAVARLSIVWPAERQDICLGLTFFLDLHTDVSRSWRKPFSSHVFGPQVSNFYPGVERTQVR